MKITANFLPKLRPSNNGKDDTGGLTTKGFASNNAKFTSYYSIFPSFKQSILTILEHTRRILKKELFYFINDLLARVKAIYMQTPTRKEYTELLSFLHDQFIEKLTESREALDFSLESPIVYDYDFKSFQKSISQYSDETEHKIFSIIALQTPNSKDLRFLLGLYKSLSDLTRVSKTILRISRISKHLDSEKTIDLVLLSSFEEMGLKLKAMFDKTIEILELNKLNIEKASELSKEFTESDDYVDSLFKDINKILIKKLGKEENTKKQANLLAEIILVVRHMERIGDHLCDMAERTLYVETGKQFAIN